MKVVIPVGDLHVGGGCKVLVDIANALHAKGHDTEIIIPQTGTVKYQVNCKLTVVPQLSKEHIPYGDVVLPNFYTTFRPAYEAWPNQCIRLSLGFEPYWVPQKEEALWTYQQDVPLLTISKWLDEQVYLHVNRRSQVVNIGVDPHVFYPKVPSTNDSNTLSRKTILYIARDPAHGYELKGFNDFKECMEIVKQKFPGDFVVSMICPEGILQLPGVPHQTFTPQTEKEMADLYRSADIFVSSSWFEAFAIPPLEAMACGTPVVSTNSGGLLDYCKHLENAFLTPPKDPEALAEGILTVLSDNVLAKRLIAGGFAAANRLTKSNYENNMVHAIEVIFSERGRN